MRSVPVSVSVPVLLLCCLRFASVSGEKNYTAETRDDNIEVTTTPIYINDSSTQNETRKFNSGEENNCFDENNPFELVISQEQMPENEENHNTTYDNDNMYITEEPELGTVSPNEIHDTKKFERRADNEYTLDQDMQESSRRETSPKIDQEMVKKAFIEEKENKIKSILSYQSDSKEIQRRTFDIMSMLGLKSEENNKDFIKIIKEVSVPVPYPEEKKIPVPVKVEVEHPIPVEVPKHYPVRVEKKVYYPVKEYISAPYPVFKKVPYLIKVSVENPVPIQVAKPYPVLIERKVPYPVEKQIPFPVKIPVVRPVPVHIPVLKKIYYPVEKKVNYPVPVHVEKAIPVPVEKPYPVYVEKKVPVLVEENISQPEIAPLETSHVFESTENKQSEYVSLNYYNTNFNKEHRVVPIEGQDINDDHIHNKLQKKRDKEDLTVQESKTEIRRKTETTTTALTTPKTQVSIKNESKVKSKKEEPVQEFGKRIKKVIRS